MNTLRIRVVEFRPDHGAGVDYKYGVQVSADTLSWWTVHKTKKLDDSLAHARELFDFIQKNQLIKDHAVLWEKKI